MAKLERLANELETMTDRPELADLIAHVRDDSYDRTLLVQELKDNKLGFFAHKLAEGAYESAQRYDGPIMTVEEVKEEAEQASESPQQHPMAADPEPAKTEEKKEDVPTTGETVENPDENTIPFEGDINTLPQCPQCKEGAQGDHTLMTYQHPYEMR